MDSDALWLAFGLVLLIEGTLPFAAPGAWRRAMLRVAALREGQIRFFGLGTILLGLLVCWLAT